MACDGKKCNSCAEAAVTPPSHHMSPVMRWRWDSRFAQLLDFWTISLCAVSLFVISCMIKREQLCNAALTAAPSHFCCDTMEQLPVRLGTALAFQTVPSLCAITLRFHSQGSSVIALNTLNRSSCITCWQELFHHRVNMVGRASAWHGCCILDHQTPCAVPVQAEILCDCVRCSDCSVGQFLSDHLWSRLLLLLLVLAALICTIILHACESCCFDSQ